VTFVAPPYSTDLQSRLLALNNAHAEELSYKDADAFAELIASAHCVLAEDLGRALLVAFCETSSYDNPNFRWLKAKYDRFIYIDRVVVGAAARGQGVARKLYAAVEARARSEKRERLVCEINLDPPNVSSDNFHIVLGFVPVGTQALPGVQKTVRYWAKELAAEG
jgi:uncharacterized protein